MQKKKINIFILILVFVILYNLFSIVQYSYRWAKLNDTPYFDFLKNRYYKDLLIFAEDFFHYRQTFYKNSGKRPIVLFGDCKIYLNGYPNEVSIGKFLSDYTNRTVCNKSYSGFSTNTILYFLQSPSFKKEVPDAEYFIYFFQGTQLYYNYFTCIFDNELLRAKYILHKNPKTKKNELKMWGQNKWVRLWDLTIFAQKIEYYNAGKHFYSPELPDTELFEALIKEIKKEINKQYKNAKFVIVVYDDEEVYFNKLTLEDEEKIMNKIAKDNDIRVIYSKNFSMERDILDGKYTDVNQIAGSPHPLPKLWEDVVPELAKELNL